MSYTLLILLQNLISIMCLIFMIATYLAIYDQLVTLDSCACFLIEKEFFFRDHRISKDTSFSTSHSLTLPLQTSTPSNICSIPPTSSHPTLHPHPSPYHPLSSHPLTFTCTPIPLPLPSPVLSTDSEKTCYKAMKWILDPHMVAGLLKLYFRELKASLIPRGELLTNIMTCIRTILEKSVHNIIIIRNLGQNRLEPLI